MYAKKLDKSQFKNQFHGTAVKTKVKPNRFFISCLEGKTTEADIAEYNMYPKFRRSYCGIETRVLL